MFLKDGKWNGDDDLTWSNWASGEGDTSDCGMGHSDLGHHWTNEGCNSAKALALCEWRGKRNLLLKCIFSVDLPYNGTG